MLYRTDIKQCGERTKVRPATGAEPVYDAGYFGGASRLPKGDLGRFAILGPA